MLPHILNRPVSLFRCPTGLAKDCFFQRHPFTGMPAGIARFEVEKTDGEDRTYIAVEDAKGYLALAQFGVVELHAWGCRRDAIEKPDRVIFDLDPGEGIAWREVVEAALHVRDELAKLGLVPFAKTTGGKGVHVVVPITRRLDWKAVHAATGALSADDRRHRARHLHHDDGPGESQAPHLHRLAPQRPQRHRGRALFVAGAQQSARICAADLGKSRRRRRAGGFELRYRSRTWWPPRATPGRRSTRPPGTCRHPGASRAERSGDDDGAPRELEGIPEAEPRELPGAALPGDLDAGPRALQPAAQGHPQPDQHEAGRPRARARRAVRPREGLRVRGQEVRHHRGRATSTR